MHTFNRSNSKNPNMNEPIPLVIVEGFLGRSAAVLWGNFEQYLNQTLQAQNKAPRRTIFASVGPVSSLHDRACELYYSLVGGTVDYGASHSDAHNHARYGKQNLPGLYPEWSESKPLHFLGHSMGGPTIIKLQELIKQGHFGPSANPKMIYSINTVSAPFRGTQAVYMLGERTDAAPAVRPLSIGAALGRAVHLISFISPLLPRVLDLHADARSLTYRQMSISGLLQQLWRSDWAEGKDATPYDCTFQAADEREADLEGDVDPRTFYQSHVACMTQKYERPESSKHHSPSRHSIISPLMYISSYIMGKFDYSTLKPPPSFFSPKFHDTALEMGEEYWANDGLVPVFSQWHPLPCCRTTCIHDEPHSQASPQPGIWYVIREDDATHTSIVPLWMGTDRQRQFWIKLGTWLDNVERQREFC
ncbi:alpha/beta-hydrolase [Mycena rebaudengoi]|nr:alpha/beta-hydrolase [Mycena rebaudengoi]